MIEHAFTWWNMVDHDDDGDEEDEDGVVLVWFILYERDYTAQTFNMIGIYTDYI